MRPGEKAMFAMCAVLGLVIGIRHMDSIVIGVLWGIGLAVPVMFLHAMIDLAIRCANEAGYVVAGLLGTWKATPQHVDGQPVCVNHQHIARPIHEISAVEVSPDVLFQAWDSPRVRIVVADPWWFRLCPG